MEFELRPWRMEDAETIARYANNPKVAANLRDAFPHPYTQRDAAAFIQSCLDADPARCCFRAIAVNGETVGSISLSIGEDISSKSAELGYWLAEPYWGQGIMPEAVRQICGFAFQTYGLARIFAVPFASGDAAAKAKAIPYVTTYGIEVTPYSSLDKVFELIVADLTEAEKYLAADEELVTATRNNASDGFTSCRITHLNLYAVQALLARAYWTMGKLDLAEDYAEKVIDSGKFPLMTTAEAWNAVETGTLNMQETVFGLYSTQYTYNFYRNHIYQGGTLALSSQYSEIYSTDLAGTDKRYSTWFDTGNSWCIKHYNKMYAQGESNPTYSGKSIPGPSLIRIPEMYYIVAEANLTKDPDKATEYLDYVVKSRDLTPFAERETGKITENNIINERRKEFFADGEDFFNMKRLQLDIAIPGGNFAGTDDATYTMPIPQSVEDNYRQ